MLAACHVEPVQRAERVDPRQLARESISDVLDEYRDAQLRSDADAVAATFTADAELYMPDAPDLIGAAAIRDAMGSRFADYTPTDMLLEREQVDVGDGVAHEIGRYEESLRAADSTMLEMRGRYAIRWRRGPEAAWRIERMLINHYPPDTAATR
jgi:ketosteroid isomerase-like protein